MEEPEDREERDVVVVGAGISGLVAARDLTRRGRRALVLEARDRVGGRTLSVPLGADTVDLGGQWIGPTQDRVRRLAQDLGVATFPQHHQGRKVLALGGRVATYEGLIPKASILSLLEAQLAIRRTDALARRVPLDRPHETEDAAALDSITVETWKRGRLFTGAARGLIDIAVRAIFAAEPRDLSFLYFLFYLASGGGLERMARIADGAQQERFVGGAQEVSKRMAAALGARVRLEAPVQAIEQDERGVTVRSARGAHRARFAILALAPALAGRIAYAPPLPAARDALTQRVPMGSVIKWVAGYDRAFWRERGLSGEAICDVGPVGAAFDDTSQDGRQPALVGFILGDAARAWSGRPPEERRAAVLESLARFFGPEAARPTAYVDRDWPADPWSRGCYVGYMPPGVLTSVGAALRAPCGRLHFAGTETATRWNGYFDGAVEAGERAAAEVDERLRS